MSPAVRTRETALIVAAGLDIEGRMRIEPALYPGTPDSLWATLQRSDEPLRCALLVGHNPSLSALARQCAAIAPGHDLPTAGLCLAGFPVGIRWSALRPEQARALSLPD